MDTCGEAALALHQAVLTVGDDSGCSDVQMDMLLLTRQSVYRVLNFRHGHVCVCVCVCVCMCGVVGMGVPYSEFILTKQPALK